MEPDTAYQYFKDEGIVDQYAKAASDIGLWRSEEAVFQRFFKHEDTLLELGCGAGRISIGMWELNYRNLMGIDISRPMIKRARHINKMLDYGCVFQQGDATSLDFPDATFDGAIFGFNGLMMIPREENRLLALSEILRVIRPGGYFVFTAHDRDHSRHRRYWQQESALWQHGEQKPELDKFGDRWEDTPSGGMYIHVPTRDELRKLLKSTGWHIEADAMRSQITTEPPDVEEFSDNTRFWVVRKPEVHK